MPRRLLWIRRDYDAASGAGVRVGGLIVGLAAHFDIVERTPEAVLGAELAAVPARPRGRASLRPSWHPGRPSGFTRRVATVLDAAAVTHGADAIVVSHPATYARLGGARPAAPLVLDAFDLLWTQSGTRQVELGPSRRPGLRQRVRRGLTLPLHALRAAAARRLELRLLAGADRVWVCSELDRERLIRSASRRSRVEVVPNFVPAPPAPEPPEDPVFESAASARGDRILFVGAMGYHANRSGLSFFLDSVWPRVREQRPSARLQVVGRWPDWARPGDEYRQPGVEVLGFVEDLEPLWRAATVFVCPLLVGSGTRIKILDAWAHGVPVVSTPVGAEGLDAVSGRDLVLAESPDELATALLTLLDDAEARQRLAAAAQARWRAEATPELAVERAAESLQRLLER
ncbi:MAG: glycosyltransferase [Acidobacteriota bacterium]